MLVLLATICSCVPKPDFPPQGTCDSGSFQGFAILNEGTFGNNEARIDIVYKEQDTVACIGVFSNKNGFSLGVVAQEAIVDNNELYVIVNNSHLLYELDKHDFLFKRSLKLPGGLSSSPRSLRIVSEDKLYISSLLDSGVYVIDRTSLQVQSIIYLKIMLL